MNKRLPVELGYCEAVDNPHLLASHFFPSKLGGKPAWLSFENLPDPLTDLSCQFCKEPCSFLMQIYAPATKEPYCFHRSLFLFVCRNDGCSRANSAGNLVVFRSQLPRENPFYHNKPIEPNDTEAIGKYVKDVSEFTSLCNLCGCSGDKRCQKCGKTTYCRPKHEEIDWTLGGHSRECQSVAEEKLVEGAAAKGKKSGKKPRNPVLFPEFELVIEAEELEAEEKEKERDEAERLKDYKQFVQQQKSVAKETEGKLAACVLSDTDLSEIEAVAKKPDKTFKRFQRRVDQNPDQVIRYQREGEPLWATDLKPSAIPRCESCGGERVFELQLMPRLLSYLGVDKLGQSLDWATVAVYTCAKSCDIGTNYKKEFLFKQDFTE